MSAKYNEQPHSAFFFRIAPSPEISYISYLNILKELGISDKYNASNSDLQHTIHNCYIRLTLFPFNSKTDILIMLARRKFKYQFLLDITSFRTLDNRYLLENIAVGTENCYQFTRDVKNIPCMELLVLSGLGIN